MSIEKLRSWFVLKKFIGSFDLIGTIHRRLRSIRNFVAYPNSGIDDADGTFVTKSEFLQVPPEKFSSN